MRCGQRPNERKGKISDDKEFDLIVQKKKKIDNRKESRISSLSLLLTETVMRLSTRRLKETERGRLAPRYLYGWGGPYSNVFIAIAEALESSNEAPHRRGSPRV